MSVQLISWAYSLTDISPTQKFVLVTLADCGGDVDEECEVTVEFIVERTCFAERTVRRALDDLAEMGLVSKRRPHGSDGRMLTTRYRFHPPVRDAGGPPVRVTAQVLSTTKNPKDQRSTKDPKVSVVQPFTSLLADTKSAREQERNDLWDALTNIFGEATTETARSLRGKVIRSLTAARASPQDVSTRVRAWPRHFNNATLTETALEKHWDALGRIPLRLEEQRNGRHIRRSSGGEWPANEGREDEPLRTDNLLRDMPG